MSERYMHEMAKTIRRQLVRDMGEEAVAKAERQAAQKPMRLEPMGDKAKINKIAVLIGERSREECGEDEFFRRLCDIVGVVLA